MIKASGLSQAELQRRSGVGQAQISRFLSDHAETARTINLDTADKLFRVVEPDYLDHFKGGAERAQNLVKIVEKLESEYARLRAKRDDLADIAKSLAGAQDVILEVAGILESFPDLD
jgi:transcriptional regulator with XRE-family HTH domain